MRRWAAALTLAALVAPAWLAAPAGAAPAALCSQSRSDGKPRVAVVIDHGSSIDARCIEIDGNMNGAQFLALRAQILNVPQPTYNASGLLCSIDGYPRTGCGEKTGSTYAYWSYWDGRSGRWVFARIGPASRRMTDGAMEGWRFQQEGSLESSGNPPRYAPDRNGICPPPAPPVAPPVAPNNPPVAPNNPPPAPNNPPPAPNNPPPAPNNPPTPPAAKAKVTASPQQPASPKTTARQPTPAAPAAPRVPPTQPTAPPLTAPPANESSDGSSNGASKPTSSDPTPSETIAGVNPSSTTKPPRTTAPASDKPQGGPTTLAEGDGDDPPGRVTNVAQAGDLTIPGSKRSSSAGWWGLGIGVGAIGASGVSARWMRRRRLP